MGILKKSYKFAFKLKNYLIRTLLSNISIFNYYLFATFLCCMSLVFIHCALLSRFSMRGIFLLKQISASLNILCVTLQFELKNAYYMFINYFWFSNSSLSDIYYNCIITELHKRILLDKTLGTSCGELSKNICPIHCPKHLPHIILYWWQL